MEKTTATNWSSVLDEIDQALAAALARLRQEPAASKAEVKPGAIEVQSAIDVRLGGLSERLGRAEEVARQADGLVASELEALGRWGDELRSLRQRLQAPLAGRDQAG